MASTHGFGGEGDLGHRWHPPQALHPCDPLVPASTARACERNAGIHAHGLRRQQHATIKQLHCRSLRLPLRLPLLLPLLLLLLLLLLARQAHAPGAAAGAGAHPTCCRVQGALAGHCTAYSRTSRSARLQKAPSALCATGGKALHAGWFVRIEGTAGQPIEGQDG